MEEARGEPPSVSWGLRLRTSHFFLSALLPLIAACQGGVSEPADLLLVNGKVFTCNDDLPWAEAVAIRGERIVAVGSSEELAGLAGPDTHRIDLGDKVVIPGINDAHRHFGPMQPEVHELELTPLTPSWEETRAAITAAAAELPPDTWIHGTVGVAVITSPEVNRATLDALAPAHPVMLSAFYGHGEILDSLALERLGIDDREADPVGGFFEREPESQRLNGRLFEYAQWNHLFPWLAKSPDATVLAALQEGSAAMLRLGITSIQVMPSMRVERYVPLLVEASLPLRSRVIRFPTTAGGRHWPETEKEVPIPDGASDRVRVDGVKWILDGTPLEWGAAMREPYSDTGETGRLNFSAEEIAAILREGAASDQQLLLHAVGDSTLATLLDAMEAMEEVDWPTRRVRIEHGDGLAADLRPRAAALGLVVVGNPTHFAFGELMAARVGADRDFQPLRSLLEAGIPVAIGSDGPPNPWLDVMLAALHPSRPSEAITVEEAILAYTRGAAFAERAESEKGTITPGKLADLAVLSQDVFSVPLDSLPATTSVLTVIGGQIVHEEADPLAELLEREGR